MVKKLDEILNILIDTVTDDLEKTRIKLSVVNYNM